MSFGGKLLVNKKNVLFKTEERRRRHTWRQNSSWSFSIKNSATRDWTKSCIRTATSRRHSNLSTILRDDRRLAVSSGC